MSHPSVLGDKELLRLASKAAGYRLCHFLDSGAYVRDDVRNIGFDWSPLTDDGDVLRLAVKLRIKSRYHEVLGQGLAWTNGDAMEAQANLEDCQRDECATLRRAIVLAAAGIGKAIA